VNEDHFIAEVIDPVTLTVKQPGEEGELVLTTITKEGFPLVRYRTGDLTTLDPSPCHCGRTLARMARIQGRIDDMINLGDVKAFPSQVEEVLAATEGVEPHYEIVVDRVDGMDTLEVRVEIAEDMPEVDEVRAIERLKERIARRLAASLGIPVKVSLAEPKSLARAGEGKLRRVVDRRQL
jgi:phenylacetate-CoA ligase